MTPELSWLILFSLILAVGSWAFTRITDGADTGASRPPWHPADCHAPCCDLGGYLM